MALRSGSVFSQAATPKQAKDVEKAAMVLQIKEMEKQIKLQEAEKVTRVASEEAEKAGHALSLKELQEHNHRLQQELTAKEVIEVGRGENEVAEKAATATTALRMTEIEEHNDRLS